MLSRQRIDAAQRGQPEPCAIQSLQLIAQADLAGKAMNADVQERADA